MNEEFTLSEKESKISLISEYIYTESKVCCDICNYESTVDVTGGYGFGDDDGSCDFYEIGWRVMRPVNKKDREFGGDIIVCKKCRNTKKVKSKYKIVKQYLG